VSTPTICVSGNLAHDGFFWSSLKMLVQGTPIKNIRLLNVKWFHWPQESTPNFHARWSTRPRNIVV